MRIKHLSKRISGVVIYLSLLTTLVACGNDKEVILGDIDRALVDMSVEHNQSLIPPGFENLYPDRRTFEVVKEESPSGYIVTVSLDGYPRYIPFPVLMNKRESNEHFKALGMYSNVENVRDEHLSVIFDAYIKLSEYIEQSTLIKDKEQVYAELEEVQFRLADLNHDVLGSNDLGMASALYDEFDNTVYISKEAVPCEAVILHEYFHVLQTITSRSHLDENPQFFDSWFVEGMTEILTRMLEPTVSSIPDDYYVSYENYFDALYTYIAIFGDEAINSYFYGFSGICEIIPEDELFLYMGVIELADSLNSHEERLIYGDIYANLVQKWLALTNP